MSFFSALLIGSFFVLAALPSLALDHTVYVTGYGRSSGYCNSHAGYFCKDNLERQAERDGQMDAERQCRSQQGDLQSTFGCSTFCNPSYIPPNDPGTWVNCSSNCHLPCRIEDHQQ